MQTDAAEILEDLIRAERFPDAEKKQVQERCYRRLAPIYDNLRRLTLLPDIKDLKDDALLNLYQSSNGEPGDEFVDALAEEIERRGLNK